MSSSAAAAAARAPKVAPAEVPQVTASHVLIAYEGAQRARATRSKEAARALATTIRDRARKGEDFGALAVQYSDDPRSKAPEETSAASPVIRW